MKVNKTVNISKRHYFALLFVMAVLLWLPFSTQAETVVRLGDEVTIDSNQRVDGDYYVSVGPIGRSSMSGTVAGDMYGFGGTVTVNGVIEEDLTLFGGVSQVHASVTDDVRVAGFETVIAEHVGGDVFVLGGTLKILSSASIDGDVFFFGKEATIEGVIKGSIHGDAQSMLIDAPVGGDVDVTVARQLTLGGEAAIEGNVLYTSTYEIVRAADSIIEGSIQQQSGLSVLDQGMLKELAIVFMTLLFAALVAYLVLRPQLQTLATNVLTNYTTPLILGSVVLLSAPFVSTILLFSVLGSLVGAALLLATLLLLVCSIVVSGVLAGSCMMQVFGGQPRVSLISIVFGTVFVFGISLIPIVGLILGFLIIAMSAGVIVLGVYQSLQSESQ